MTLLDVLSDHVGAAFGAAGLPTEFGRVAPADRPDLAQFQCNGALAAAKEAEKNPRAIAEDICARLADADVFSEATVAGPGFINLKLDDGWLARRVDALHADVGVGAWRRAEPEKIVVDYGGPNVAKPLHVGHLRPAIIGECLKRLCRAVGDDAVGDVHLGDWGLQMGQLITELEDRAPDLPYFDAAYEGPYPAAAPISLTDLEEMYPAAAAASKAHAERAERARLATKALQSGRPGYRALWRRFVDLSVSAMREEYEALGVRFELWKGESDANPLIGEIADDLKSRGLLEESDGAQIIRVARESDNKTVPPVIFLSSQGAANYHSTDIATILDRVRSLKPDRMLYVVDARQKLHFEQVFRAVDKAGYFDEARLEHLWFGTMNGKDGKPFKTREGGVLKLRAFLETLTERAAERLSASGLAQDYAPDEVAEIARRVGIAALKFADLSNPRTSDYIFDIDRFMAFEGKTGPYLLYARVRISAVLARAAEKGAAEGGPTVIGAEEERQLALGLASFADAVRESYEKRLPHILCDHVFRLAQAFSKFYAAHRIADEPDKRLRASRRRFAEATGRQLDAVFEILGLDAPARM